MTSPPERLPRSITARELGLEAPASLPVLLVHERDRPGESAAGPSRRLMAVGDIGFSGRIAAILGVADGDDPFRDVAPVLRQADLAFANLETPLLGAPAGRLFAGSTDDAARLAMGGFGLVNLANNHLFDHGPEGLRSTRAALAAAGVADVGACREPRRPKVVDLGGLRLGVLAAARTLAPQPDGDEGFWEYNPEALREAVLRLRPRVDVVVVSLHLGYMLIDVPHPGQRREVLALLEAGADLVLGHHAHVLQGIEVTTAGGVACHNLGNFLLDWSEGEIPIESFVREQRSGAVVVVDLDRKGVRRVAALPVWVDDGFTVRWATEERGPAILDRLERLSRFDGSRAAAGAAAAEFHRQLAERVGEHSLRSVMAELRRGGPRAVLSLFARLRPHHVGMLGRVLWRRLRGRGE